MADTAESGKSCMCLPVYVCTVVHGYDVQLHDMSTCATCPPVLIHQTPGTVHRNGMDYFTTCRWPELLKFTILVLRVISVSLQEALRGQSTE